MVLDSKGLPASMIVKRIALVNLDGPEMGSYPNSNLFSTVIRSHEIVQASGKDNVLQTPRISCSLGP